MRMTERRLLDALEQIPPAHAETTHDMGIHAIEAARDRRIALACKELGVPSRASTPVRAEYPGGLPLQPVLRLTHPGSTRTIG